jgi:glycosyltransferase involved in cell wall biosynthesis
MDTLIILCSVALLITCVIATAFFANVRRIGKFNAVETTGETPELVSVIIPARNEQDDLQQSLKSVLEQQGVRLEVIVINDHSEDRTGEIADAVAARDDRVSVIHNPPLQPGWLGKCNAMETGRRRARGHYILLTDADILHHPRCLTSALAHFNRHNLDFFSMWPKILCVSFWENVFIPSGIIGGGAMLWLPPKMWKKQNHAAAAGAFMLTKAAVLERLGGFESIKHEMLDDVALARRVLAAGCPIDYRLGPELVQVRLFKNNRHAFWGATKNVLGFIDNTWLALPLILLPFLVFWSPPLGVVVGVATGDVLLASLGLAAIVLQLVLFASVRPWCRFQWHKAIFYPLCAVQCACCIVRALFHRFSNRAVLWRGRAISVTSSSS